MGLPVRQPGEGRGPGSPAPAPCSAEGYKDMWVIWGGSVQVWEARRGQMGRNCQPSLTKSSLIAQEQAQAICKVLSSAFDSVLTSEKP